VVEPLSRQWKSALEAVVDYAQARLAYLRELDARPPGGDELDGPGQSGETVETRTYTYQTRHIPCGPGCGGCPHGPYTYRFYRENGDVKSEYVGTGRASEYAGAD
jgi:hypothetical protein